MNLIPALRKASIILTMLLCSKIMGGQNYSFRNYGSEYGIPNGFVYTINQANNGFLWVGTGDGLARFDGYEYYRVNFPDSLGNRNINVSFRDNRGTLWFGCSDGSVLYTSGTELKAYRLKNTRSISQILQGPDNQVYIIPQGKLLFSINPEKPDDYKKYEIPDDYIMQSAALSPSGELLIGSQGTLHIASVEKDTVLFGKSIEEFGYSGITAICKVPGFDEYIIGTEDDGVYRLRLDSRNYSVSRFENHPEWSELNVRSVFADSENYISISTFGSGVIRFSVNSDGDPGKEERFNTVTGLASDDVKLVFRDMEGNYWFGLFGEGVSMLSSNAFGLFLPGKNSSENNILYVNRYDGNYLLGTPVGFHLFDPVSGSAVSYTGLLQKTGASILSYWLDENKNLWIGTDGNGLYLRNASGAIRQFYRSGDSGADRINDILVNGTGVWLATTNGVVVLDKTSGKKISGFSINDGLPHNSINRLAEDAGSIYIGTESDRLYCIDKDFNIISRPCIMNGSTINKILGFAAASDGSLWAATNGNGIFICRNDSVITLNRANGLLSNYCYNIFRDNKNNIWVGHAKGFSKVEPATGIVKTFDSEYVKGGICNPSGMYQSDDGKIFIGTTEGLIVYDSAKDSSGNVPPLNNITSININDKEYPLENVIELPYRKYRIRVRFSGINFSNPDKVYYQTYLENFDEGWSKPSPLREVTYMLSNGKYRFHLLSVDEEGRTSESDSTFTIIIARPFYKEWWFIILAIVAVAASIFLIIRQRDRAQKKVRSYLEDELKKRTSVIVKQKTEIELQNVEITDSINYAKRIQSSILPDINKLKENFNEAFVIFHPRDIVSGDFYWFDKVDNDKFVLVCADSTGHGVPGAFMSMIGSTLLQDIVTRKKISLPSHVLGLLDKQIFSTLNQNVDHLGVSNDGMDMVVCEFNIRTRHVRFASAMRPIIIVMAGEPYYIKGNRSSVGGESVIEKYFDDQEYYLNEGDSLYLFSDGFPDQFGGSDGKKMKIARLKSLIEHISHLPMKEQELMIRKFYNEWKGDYEQVDDILLIGVRV
jgi:ligand-binding sensor domain-containing protein/serine phosphatase RsbU (regulator of sigma subunit)